MKNWLKLANILKKLEDFGNKLFDWITWKKLEESSLNWNIGNPDYHGRISHTIHQLWAIVIDTRDIETTDRNILVYRQRFLIMTTTVAG